MSLTETLVDSDADKDAQSSGLPFPVVGIGASAGGLAAIRTLLEGLPRDSGMAFVVVLHLSPTHESNAAAIFQLSTRMPVLQVAERVRVEPDHVYVIPPNHELRMTDGELELLPAADRLRGRHTVIDVFFRTLAYAHKTRAIGIVLSGTGSDGAVGIAALKEKGGIALAQTPDDAEHPGMPASAIATGKVDIVLPVAEMASQLVELWQNASRIEIPEPQQVDSNAQPTTAPGGAEQALREVMKLLQLRTGHDFANYKRATVLRRIERRMQVTRNSTLPAYRNFLEAEPHEPKALLEDMLIGVTQFFRDRPAFEALERDIVPRIFAEQEDELGPVRAWVIGCATGEEAYSVAMLLADEAMRQRPAGHFTLFATDIDAAAIAFARNALYPKAIATDVPPGQLRAFFSLERGGYQVHKALREKVIFAEHSVLKDPPFSHVALISCRNLLIYLNRAAQQEVLQLFHFALRPGGFLFLGSSETVDASSRLFSPVDKANRIYRANPIGRTVRLSPARSRDEPPAAAPAPPASIAAPVNAAALHRDLVERFAPPSILVTEGGEIVHVGHGTTRYLRYPAGEPSHSLQGALRGELRAAARTAMVQATQLKKRIDADPVMIGGEGGERMRVRMTVVPARHPSSSEELLLVAFDEEPAPREAAPPPTGDPVLARLEDELSRRGEQLRTTIEQYEASAEELKASNEELQAINEELRSATEELETSKEELQSTNEELITVNQELKDKIEEANGTLDDLNNLISSSDIATVFVDPQMRIKRFTPAAAQIFNLIPADVGRSLFDITHRLDYADLAEDASAVFTSLRPIEREVQMGQRRLLARLLPYRTTENRISGAVLNFIDLTTLRQAQAQVDVSRERAALVAETMTDFAIMTMDPEGVITSWNPGATNVFDYAEREIVGRHFELLFTQEDRDVGIPASELHTARTRGRAPDERWMRRKDGSTFFASGVSAPLKAGIERGFAKICRDMTGLRRVEELHEQALMTAQMSEALAVAENQQKNEFLAVMSHELKHPLNLISVNAQLLTTLAETQQLPAVLRAARTIQRTAMSQGRIIDDLLDMSRINTGKLTVNRVPLVLGEAIQPAVNWAIAEARLRNIRVFAEGLDEALAIDGDVTRIEQIAWNLLSNAIKFSPTGGTIRIHVEQSGDEAMLCVADNGRGIEPEFLPHLFELFKQADSSTRRPEGGLGIGLAMVKSLTELHGGRVEVESAGRGAGTTFKVFLPLHQSSDFAPLGEAFEMPAGTLVTGPLRILYVDDTEDSLETFTYLLEHAGHEVVTARSGQEALERADGAQPFDLLISDIGMPDMDGYQLVEALRGRPGTAALPAIALTGHGRTEDVKRAFAAGFHAHVDKPVDFEHMKRVIATVITTWRGSRGEGGASIAREPSDSQPPKE